MNFYPHLLTFANNLDVYSIPEDRKKVLYVVIEYIRDKLKVNKKVNLNFICTHNSRRSQFSQVWAHFFSRYFGIDDIYCGSGGVEVTAFNERAVAAVTRVGFKVSGTNDKNTHYRLTYDDDDQPITAYSKLFDDAFAKGQKFAAIMTCSDADENCPYIPGADVRIPLRYEDPKVFDDTKQEQPKYDERCKEIATEMKYIFGNVLS